MKGQAAALEIDPQELIALAQRESPQDVSAEEWKTVQASLMTTIALWEAYHGKAHALRNVLRLIFGPKSEKAKDVFKEDDTDKTAESSQDKGESDDEDKKPESSSVGTSKGDGRKGGGRRGADDYPGLANIPVGHPSLKAGDACPLCLKGGLNRYKGRRVLRFKGQPPVGGNIYELERFRCNACGAIFTAPLPKEAGEQKYDETVGSILALLKYGSGMPWYRLANLQNSLGIPLSASTQWDITEHTANKIHPVFPELVRQAAQGELFLNDDTVMKVLDLVRENRQDNPDRTGLFSSGVLSVSGDHKVALFFTGRNHAGENLAKVLEKRHPDRGPPVQVSDALSRNVPEGHATIHGFCNDHGRRRFVDAANAFPEQCLYVIETLGKVYKNDETTRARNMDPWQRLRFHCRHSAQVMAELRLWLQDQFEEKNVEPNSSLGRAIAHMLKNWRQFTLFLWWPGVPLSSCLVEQAIKTLVLGRKNFLFYRTQHGAFIGDMFMSIIHTCNLNGINAFNYITALQVHSTDVFRNPERWMPWDYELRIAEIEQETEIVACPAASEAVTADPTPPA